MKKKYQYYIVIACFNAAYIDLSQAYSLCEEYRNYPVPAYVEYAELLCKGEDSVRNKNWELATEKFSKALKFKLHEVPNYEPTVKLGLSYCMLGKYDEGYVLLDEFACMLKIEAGDINCADLGKQNKNRSAANKECYQVMCGEMYLPYYGTEDANTVNRIKLLRKELEDARKACFAEEAKE